MSVEEDNAYWLDRQRSFALDAAVAYLAEFNQSDKRIPAEQVVGYAIVFDRFLREGR